MKRLNLSIFILFFVFIFYSAISVHAQAPLTAEEWKEDIHYLQNKIHTDYPFLFKKISEQDFDSAVDKLIERVPQLKPHEITVGIAELVALFGYGHTVLWLTSWRYNENIGFHQLPINYYSFSDGIYIQGAHKDFKNLVGAKVLKVGHLPVNEALQAVKSVVSAENDQFFIAHGIHYLGVPEVLHAKGVIETPDEVQLELEKDGKQFNVKVKPKISNVFPGNYSMIFENEEWTDARDNSTTPLWLKQIHKSYFMEYLPLTKTVYVRHSLVRNEEDQTLEAFFKGVFDFIEGNEVDKFILDVRLNSGGNNFLNRALIKEVIRSKIDEKGKFYTIIGRRTFSACQNLVNELEYYTNVTFVGEPTAENVNFYGDNNREELPNSKIAVRLSYAWWQDIDGRDTRQWTRPAIPASLSFLDYVNNIDPALDNIEKFSVVERELETLSKTKNFENLKKAILKYKDKEGYGFINYENKINSLGYDYIGQNEIIIALQLFELNTQLNPESANCWDSLAEAYWRSDNIEKAKQYYKKAIAMDPDGRVGENSKMMLEQIENTNN